jgi:MOSC domain-containing protein YiiM
VRNSGWAPAGDQLFLDFDLGEANLKPGNRIRIGDTAVIEVTPLPHNGCRKFAARYGKHAVKWVNSPEGKRLHLRGVNAKVVTGGVIRQGDPVSRGVRAHCFSFPAGC